MPLPAVSAAIVVVKRPRAGLFAAVRSLPVWLRALSRGGRGARVRVDPVAVPRPISQDRPAGTRPPEAAEQAIETARSVERGGRERSESTERLALCAALAERGAVVAEGADAVPIAELPAAAAGALLRWLRDVHDPRFDVLDDLTVVDRLPESPRFDVVYFLRASRSGARLRVRARIEVEPPELDSAASIWRSADWLEREAKDLFGVRFRGHPGLLPILLPPDFEGAPLRRDFSWVDAANAANAADEAADAGEDARS